MAGRGGAPRQRSRRSTGSPHKHGWRTCPSRGRGAGSGDTSPRVRGGETLLEPGTLGGSRARDLTWNSARRARAGSLSCARRAGAGESVTVVLRAGDPGVAASERARRRCRDADPPVGTSGCRRTSDSRGCPARTPGLGRLEDIVTIARRTVVVWTSATVVAAAVTVSVVVGYGRTSQGPFGRLTGQSGPTPVANRETVPHKATLSHVSVFAHMGAAKPGEVRVEEVGADWEPAPPNAVAAVAAATAVSSARANLRVMSAQPTSATARLVLYQNVFGAVQADGTMKPSVPWQLAWLVQSLGTGVIPHSHPYVPGTPAPTPATFTCSFAVVISAHTGERLDGYRIC